MSRKKRAATAKETLAICQSGLYQNEKGKNVRLRREIEAAIASSVTYDEDSLASRPPARFESTRIEVTGESTFEAIERATQESSDEKHHVGCLNFASAKNPGGGFLGGSQAQEEALARASALYPCLQSQFSNYYEPNRAARSSLYLDRIIVSIRVPFFRNDDSRLIETPLLSTVVTAPAPNAGAVIKNQPEDRNKIAGVFAKRAEMVLRAAASHEVDTLVLGAWGCGVFRNDPNEVAGIFRDLIQKEGDYATAFARVIFAVHDPGGKGANYRAFEKAFP